MALEITPVDRDVLLSATDTDRCASILSSGILGVFDDFYEDFCEIPAKAKLAFETSNFKQSIENSHHRLVLYSKQMYALARALPEQYPKAVNANGLWDQLELYYREAVSGRYEADLALAFLHSVRRVVFLDEWNPVDYLVNVEAESDHDRDAMLCRTVSKIDGSLLQEILSVVDFSIPFRDEAGDIERTQVRINQHLMERGVLDQVVGVDAIKGGFFS